MLHKVLKWLAFKTLFWNVLKSECKQKLSVCVFNLSWSFSVKGAFQGITGNRSDAYQTVKTR